MSLVGDVSGFRSRLAEIVGWETATRDDTRVAEVLFRDRLLDRVHSLDEVAFFDEFFAYLREIGVWPLLEALDPGERRGALIPFLRFVMVSLMRCVGGVNSMLATHDVLLTDEALMGLVGFNAVQVREGCNGRGLDRKKAPVEVRGAFSYETLADNLVQIPKEKLTALFNGAIRCLASRGLFPQEMDVSLDASDIEATPTYQTDDGRPVAFVMREKRPDVRANRHAKKVETRVYGWKVWTVWSPEVGVPLAILLDDIDVHENQRGEEVLRQAVANLEGHSVLRSVALDRGFLDGKLLTRIEQFVPRIYIPAQRSMTIAKDARKLARQTEQQVEATGTAPATCRLRERHLEVKQGAGKKQKKEIQTTSLVSIEGLPCDWWNPNGSEGSQANSKRFQAREIHAVVVLRWEGAPKDAEKEVVLLTNDPEGAENPFLTFDRYDARSRIENGCFREAKEKWHLESHPKRSEAGVWVQTYLVFLCMALVEGFRRHKAQVEEAAREEKVVGIERYRREIQRENRDKVIVFTGDHYGVFRTHEITLLLGARVREQEAAGITQATVLAKYGVSPDTS